MKDFYIYLSTLVIPAVIFLMAITLLYNFLGFNRETATKVFYVLFWLQIGWIFLFPIFIKEAKWAAIGLAVFLAGFHLYTSFFAGMAISGVWL